MSTFLELYEPLDVIGNGAFGVVRKVRRKSDGLTLARKEIIIGRKDLDWERIATEVNILRELDHEHIVRYHDQHIDNNAGMLYILMEYCGGGDLSGIIKQAQEHKRPVSEDIIWNYFIQILWALRYCHHPPNRGPSSDGKERRPQILHRDLKPENVFLDDNNIVKLGDFGLSKALTQAKFAETYVGTPLYMSPELMDGKAYGSKSDIWSLGCLIYELCALKPPFQAKRYADLSKFIRSGDIPPLPGGYSKKLSSAIGVMLSLDPARRPSAADLLQHELLTQIIKVVEAEKMLSTVKTHKVVVIAKEREISARETAKLTALMVEKDAEILRLHNLFSTAQSELDTRIREAIGKREEELRVAIRKCEEEVAATMARREEEILSAVRQREQEIIGAWRTRKEQIKEAEEVIAERKQWIAAKEADLGTKLARLSSQEVKGRKEKTPLEEVKNVLAPLVQMTKERGPITTRAKSGGGEAARFGLADKESDPSPLILRPKVERERPVVTVRMWNLPPNSGEEEEPFGALLGW